ncbi:PREDICTED: large neutral amino acids transporter small subunit 2-like [Priapulus caudatus]|uniref:Large neutral amino acids transporter small subunit 2-like n=1 Tax=Priapulus caudatus TaxID=37621 RepID=A0ABM1E5J8_PRICU|nr:PREDICTED: large neutral amino acids transporter small subunit 2-like [Priapulus caudatus]
MATDTKYSPVKAAAAAAPAGGAGVDAASEGISLKPKITLLNGVTVIVGSIIGSGIFVSPKGVLQYTGSVGMFLLVWLFCGIFSTIGAYCYCELGTLIQRSGADYAYIYEAFGPLLAFMRLWVECVIVRPCSQAIVAMTFGIYILKPFYTECEPPDDAVRLLAAVCIIVLMFINCVNVKWAMRVQDVFTFAKLLSLAIIVITGIVMLCLGNFENFHSPFSNTTTDVTSIALAFYSGLFAYNGWNYLNFVIEELQEPEKNLPKAVGISMIIVVFIYVMTNIAFLTVVSPAEILQSPAVAVLFADRLYGVMAWIMPVMVAMSTFGTVNGILFTSARLFYVGAREGHMPEVLTMIQVKLLTPMPAVIFMGLLSLLYLGSSEIYALINYVSFVCWLAIGLAVFSVLWFRWKWPDAPRPIKVNIIWPILYTLGSIFLVVLPAIAEPKDTGIGALIMLTGFPSLFSFVK